MVVRLAAETARDSTVMFPDASMRASPMVMLLAADAENHWKGMAARPSNVVKRPASCGDCRRLSMDL